MSTQELIAEIRAVNESQRKFRIAENEIDYIFQLIEDKMFIEKEQILSKIREAEVVHARYIAMYFMREKEGKTLKFIGEYFNRDHATVIHALNRIKDAVASRDSKFIIKLKLFGIC